MPPRPVESALELALLVIRSGGSTVMADRTFENVLKGCRVEGVAVAWRLDFVETTRGDGDGPPAPMLRHVGPISSDVLRASAAELLSERVARGEVPPAALDAEVERVRAIAPPYGRWATLLAAALASAFFSRTAGGDWGSFGLAFVAAGVGHLLKAPLHARGFEIASMTFLCGVASASVAGLGLRLGWSQATPATLIGAVVYVIPGLPLINGFVDVVSHKHLFIGLSRIANAAFLFLVLAIAIAFAYSIIM